MKSHVWEIGLRVGKKAFRLGFCEGYLCVGSEMKLVRPFTACSLLSEPGLSLCRGRWLNPIALDARECCLIVRETEPWMWLEMEDLRRVADFIEGLEIDGGVSGGFKRRLNW